MKNSKNKDLIIIFLSCALLLFFSLFMLAIFNPYPLHYKSEIQKYSEIHNVSPAIIASIVNAESSFDKNAMSQSGALGLMQILPSTAKWVSDTLDLTYEKSKLFEVDFNLNVGTYYIKYLMEKFNDLKTALCAYNAGEGNVMLWLLNNEYSKDGITLSSTPFSETNNYVNKVLKGIEVYKTKI